MLERTGRFAAHLLAADAGDVARRFAADASGRFAAPGTWRWHADGLPQVHGAVLRLRGDLLSLTGAGDNRLALGAVHAADHGAYNVATARTAEQAGFDYALTQVRYLASYGADAQHESTAFSLALLGATHRLRVIAAVHPGFWHPAVLAKLAATAQAVSGGRFALNVVSGWFKGEFTALGEPWREHDERYRRSEEFIEVLRGAWAQDGFTYRGDSYRTRDLTFRL